MSSSIAFSVACVCAPSAGRGGRDGRGASQTAGEARAGRVPSQGQEDRGTEGGDGTASEGGRRQQQGGQSHLPLENNEIEVQPPAVLQVAGVLPGGGRGGAQGGGGAQSGGGAGM